MVVATTLLLGTRNYRRLGNRNNRKAEGSSAVANNWLAILSRSLNTCITIRSIHYYEIFTHHYDIRYDDTSRKEAILSTKSRYNAFKVQNTFQYKFLFNHQILPLLTLPYSLTSDVLLYRRGVIRLSFAFEG